MNKNLFITAALVASAHIRPWPPMRLSECRSRPRHRPPYLRLDRPLCGRSSRLCRGTFELEYAHLISRQLVRPVPVLRYLHWAGKLLRGTADRLRLHAAEPRRTRCPARCLVSKLSTQTTSPSAAFRSSPRRRSAWRAIARMCCIPAPCALALVTLPATGSSMDRRFRLDLRPTDADATGRRHDDRFPIPVATGLGGGGRHRVRIRAELDGERRVSVHAIRQQQCVVSECRAAVHIRFLPAAGARRAELSLRRLAGRRKWRLDRAAHAGHGPCELSRSKHLQRGKATRRSDRPIRGPFSLPGSGLGRETSTRRSLPAYGSGKVPSCGSFPEIDQGFGLRGHARRRRISERRKSYKLGSSYPYTRACNARFLRQTIDLGGEFEKVDADISQFAGTRRRTAWC